MLQIVKKSKLWFLFSSLLILISLGSMTANKVLNGNFLNFGIDFTGGTMIEVNFEEVTEKEKLSSFLEENYSDLYPKVQATGESEFLLKTKALEEEIQKDLEQKLKENFGNFQIPQFTTIGPSIGAKMKQNAFIALAVALIAIIFYIAFVFRNLPEELSSFKFGFVAIAALTHDILVTVGVFSLMGFFFGTEIDSLFITALLTVMGFSVHDTIVVFDRIRENVHRKSPTDTFGEISNKAVNQTLRRSINTSVSTLFPLVALLIFGSDSIFLFVLALTVGIAIGTYSSIFLATPLLVAVSHKGELSDLPKKKSD